MVAFAVVLVAGLAVGSFLDACAGRLAAGRSLLAARSRCDACATALGPLDLVPVLSYLALRGRCRYCAAPITKRALAVEAGAGLLFVLAWALVWR